MDAIKLFLIALLVTACSASWKPNVRLVRADGASHVVGVEVALNDQQRERGLMGRASLPDDTGMLFAFPGDTDIPFWMKDTPLALSIAFIAADGRIVDIQDMQPETTDLHQPASRYRYALEVSQGYFNRVGVKRGDRAELPAMPQPH